MSGNTFTGLLHVPKHARPRTTTAADGTFQLTLPLRDNQGAHRVEPWLVLWTGEEAKAWWRANGATLAPGSSLVVTLTHLRAHGTTGRFGEAPEIHARVRSLAIAPARWDSLARQANPIAENAPT